MHDDSFNKNFENALKKLEISNSVPESIEKKIRKSERDNYIKLLKMTGQYSFFAAICAYVIFFFKQFGINLSIIQSTIVLVVSSASLVVSLSTGIYLSIDSVVAPPEKKNILQKEIERVQETFRDQTISTLKPEPKPKERSVLFKKPIIAIEAFQSTGTSPEIMKMVQDKLKGSLRKLRGKKSIVSYIPKGNDYVVLKGFLDSSNHHYTLDIKIYDAKKMEYIFFATETVTTKEELGRACVKISRKINQKFK